jgi:pimeloyl-ACP methyl ester carboxylesterase
MQILLSGATYGPEYWDLPYRPDRYSYVAAMAASGHGTLNLDRLGIASSDHPPADQLTVAMHATALHQVVSQVRHNLRPAAVVVVGHSLGSAVAQLEAAIHHDVDGLILTGALHAEPTGAPEFLASLIPAAQDRRLAARPTGYLTTSPGSRGRLFYHAGRMVEPDVVLQDEQHKETLAAAELQTLPQALDPAVAAAIDVDVLTVVGEYDNLWRPDGTGPLEQEKDLFTAAPSTAELVLPDAGHATNLHRNAADWYTQTLHWLQRFGS